MYSIRCITLEMSEYTKPCTTCKAEIRMSNSTGKWLPYNLDNSVHRCLPADRYKPTQQQQKPQPDAKPLTLEGLNARLKRVEKILFTEQEGK